MNDLEILAQAYQTDYSSLRINANSIWDTYKAFALREGIFEYFVMKMNLKS